MAGFAVNGVTALLMLGIMYALASEGLWGAALMFFNVLFSALIAFNFYEPLADLLAKNVSAMAGYADTLCLLGLFIVSIVIFRIVTETIAPAMVRFPLPLYHAGRWLFGFLTGAVTIAIVLLAFETSPVHKKMFGVMDYDFKPPWGMALDRHWLAFFQYTTGCVFANYNDENGNHGDYLNAKLFDPQGSWLIDHQNARPYGNDFVPAEAAGEGEAKAAGAGEAGTGEAGAPAPQAPPGGPPGAPGGGGPPPQGGPPRDTPKVPGGPTGAAAGLAPM